MTTLNSMFYKILKITGVVLSVIFVLIVLAVLLAFISPNARIVLPVEHHPEFDPNRYNFADGFNSFPGALRTRGREIIGHEGTPVKLLGLMAPDPAHLDNKGKFNKAFMSKSMKREQMSFVFQFTQSDGSRILIICGVISIRSSAGRGR